MDSEAELFQDDLIRMDEVQTWATESLKDYCKKRGYKVSGTRSELCARVYFLYNNKTPEVPTLKDQERSKKNDYQALLNYGTRASDPFELKTWIGEQQGIQKWPLISYNEIVKFITRHGHSLSGDALTSYKTGKAYGYFYSDWLKEVFYHQVKGTDVCYLKAACTPSNRLSDEPHSLWVKAEANGNIQSAFCTCVAG